ncbi:hypothetical protein PG995_009755 [Apiospora arundinis]
MSQQRPTNPAMRRLVDFYDPATKGEDVGGRTLDEILRWPDTRLEAIHNYIQILFPLPEGSLFNPWAPVVDEEGYLYLSQNDDFKPTMRRVLTRMLSFYGFDITWDTNAEGKRLVALTPKSGAWTQKSLPHWVCWMDHNHLRISRILRSLRVLGLEDEANAFFTALVWTVETHGRIGENSVKFWKRAVERPLHVAPDGTEVDWLKKYEGRKVEKKKDDSATAMAPAKLSSETSS